jgi:hypothetical protein
MNDINYSKLSICDEEGRVFEKNGTIYRAIYTSNAKIIQFLNTNLCKELEEKGFIPKTKITDFKLDGYQVVLEHETANYINYPHEWSFQMLKDACLLLLEIDEISNKHGYNLKDGHMFNIVFFNGKPKFVDIGSIVPKGNGNYSYLDEFKNRAFLPLLLWSESQYGLAFNIIRENSFHLNTNELINLYRGIVLVQDFGIKSFLNYLKARKNVFPLFYTSKIQDLKKAIVALELKNYKSTWVNYHQPFYQGDKIQTTPRFEKLISIVNDLNISSMCDVASNEGVFSILVNERCKQVKKIISIDYDENAINNFYKKLAQASHLSKITAIVNNIVAPSINYFEILPELRYKSDCVVALALTHHLILGQNYHIDVIFNRLLSITNKYLIVEFMPLGLWGGEGHELPKLPAFYTEKWFEENLSKQAKIIAKHKLESNRICFVCEK